MSLVGKANSICEHPSGCRQAALFAKPLTRITYLHGSNLCEVEFLGAARRARTSALCPPRVLSVVCIFASRSVRPLRTITLLRADVENISYNPSGDLGKRQAQRGRQ